MLKHVLALLSLVVVAGCGPHRYLVWEAAPPAPSLMGRAAINVTDHREPKKGGDDPSVVGFQRSGFGIPYPIHIGNPGQLSMDMHELLAEAMMSVGVAVLAPGQDQGASSRVMVDIQSFWCDGYWPVFKGGIVAGVTIVDGATNQVRVPGQPLAAEGAAGDCRTAYHKALNALFNNARAMFGSPQIHEALVAAGPPPMGGAPPPPPPPAQ